MKFELDLNAVNLVTDALADRPYRQVAGLIADIQMQARAQIAADEQAARVRAASVAKDAEELAKLKSQGTVSAQSAIAPAQAPAADPAERHVVVAEEPAAA